MDSESYNCRIYEKLNEKEKMIINKRFLKVEHKWKLQKKLEYRKLKFQDLKEQQ